MIKVFGRILCVPESEKELGYVADNFVETRQFRITDPSLFPFSFKLELENGSFTDIVDLSPTKDDDTLILTWEIANSHLRFQGPLYAQLRAFSESGTVWHSEITTFNVQKSIEANSVFPTVLPSEFSEMESRMQKLLTDTVAASAEATEATSALNVLLQNAEEVASASEKSAKESASASATATASAKSAESAASSASADATYVRSAIGDIESALDAILSLQASYIGGDVA